MRRKKHLSFPLITAILLLLVLVCYIIFIDPSRDITVFSISISPIPIMLTLTALTVFVSTSAVLKNKRRGLLITLCISSILLLRLFDYTNPIFIGLILAIGLMLECVLPRSLFQKAESKRSRSKNTH